MFKSTQHLKRKLAIYGTETYVLLTYFWMELLNSEIFPEQESDCPKIAKLIFQKGDRYGVLITKKF